jgi:hypothetical protein
LVFTNVERSRYTVWYTLYFSCWAVNFLGRWERKENELRFLWGNVEVRHVQKPRPQFEGVLRELSDKQCSVDKKTWLHLTNNTDMPAGVNFVTGRELMVPRNPPAQYAKRAFSWFLIVLILVFTTFAALAAESLALLARKPENLCNPGICRSKLNNRNTAFQQENLSGRRLFSCICCKWGNSG